VVGFNEFCAFCLVEAIDQAAAQGANKVNVITTIIMTQGGEHSENDMPKNY